MNLQVNKLRWAVAACLLAAAGGAAAADTSPSQEGGLSPADREFVTQAAQGGLLEIAAGKLAATRAQDPAVKAFGQKLVTDHTQADDKLNALAASKQLTLPDAVSADGQEVLGKLEGLNGTEFDKTFVSMMVKDHVTDIKQFQKEAQGGNDPDIKAYAVQTLPTLRHHLREANTLTKQQDKG